MTAVITETGFVASGGGDSAKTLAATNAPMIAYNNLAASATVSTGIGVEVQSASYAVTGTTYDQWVVTPYVGSVAFHVDFGVATYVDFTGVAAHNLATIGATVRAQSSDDGVIWTDTGEGPITPDNDNALAFYTDGVFARYHRILITGAGTSDVSAGVIHFGTVIAVPRRIYQGYLPPITPTIVDLQSNVSEGGNLLGSTIVRRGSVTTASFTYVRPSFIRGEVWVPFQRHFNAGKGFFWDWRPDKYDDVKYVWREGATIAPTNSGPHELMSFEMPMRVYHK